MAKLNGFKALFSSAAINKTLQDSLKKWEDKTLQSMAYMGERFVNQARSSGSYKDRTGNLRSSIGYVVLKDGKIVTNSFSSEGGKGKSKGAKVAKEIAAKHPDGFVLIGVAGMGYAFHVEKRGLDVITGSEPNSKQLKNMLSAIKF